MRGAEKPSTRRVLWEGVIGTATRVIGGGYASGKTDPDCPIRATEIKSQLRFWWRAIHGVRLGSLEAMREREDQLFGAARVTTREFCHGGQGLVDVVVTEGESRQPESLSGDRSVPGYIKQLLTQGGGDCETSSPKAKLCVTAHLARVEDSEAACREVLDSLAAFFAYGGVGARTRRGAGTVEVASTLQGSLPAAPRPGQAGESRLDTPGLPKGSLLVGPPVATAAEAWARAVAVFQLLRKGASVDLVFDKSMRQVPTEFQERYEDWAGKFAQRARPTDQLRALLGEDGSWRHTSWPERSFFQSLNRGNNRQDIPNRESDLPRVQFGLPLQFGFLDGHDNKPEKHYLVNGLQNDPNLGADGPRKSDRFASPVIVKAMKDGDRWRPMILTLAIDPIKAEHLRFQTATHLPRWNDDSVKVRAVRLTRKMYPVVNRERYLGLVGKILVTKSESDQYKILDAYIEKVNEEVALPVFVRDVLICANIKWQEVKA